ncbi:hypothetical protein CNMCM7691_007794 [Aspergillus felis]|uniref:Uncharacterized protein n=1 Tax=Aspergillus felis TaxID=1287682 RepID=A0A8H6VFC7_9EURO|nr:hypothetical protein CNMCM7691_007794 [Aspergillus felis]
MLVAEEEVQPDWKGQRVEVEELARMASSTSMEEVAVSPNQAKEEMRWLRTALKLVSAEKTVAVVDEHLEALEQRRQEAVELAKPPGLTYKASHGWLLCQPRPDCAIWASLLRRVLPVEEQWMYRYLRHRRRCRYCFVLGWLREQVVPGHSGVSTCQEQEVHLPLEVQPI